MGGLILLFMSLVLFNLGPGAFCQLQVPLVAQSDFLMKIRCHECDSSINPECANPSELQYFYTDCSGIPGESDRCLKATGPGVLIRRGCGGLPTDGQIARAPDGCFMQQDVQACMCSTEKCNGSPHLTLSLLTSLAISFGILRRILF